MNLVLLITSLIILISFVFNKIISYKRFVLVSKLNSSYDKMEMFFAKNNIALSRNHIEFLKVFKNLAVNPMYLDIQILLFAKMAAERAGKLEKNRKWFEDTMESLPKEFKNLYKEFDISSTKLVVLSIYKPSFVYFTLKLIILGVIESGVNAFKILLSDFEFLKNNESSISYSATQLNHNLC